MVATILGSLLFGAVIGRLLVGLMWFKRFPARYLILPLGLAVFVATNWFTDWSHANLPYVINFEPLLICIAGGYVCTNTSKHRHRFIQVLQQAGPYVFLPFFTLTGASLDLKVLGASAGFAALLVVVRATSVFVGSAAGGWLAGAASQHSWHIWMTLLTQAGVSLGLASEVGMSFPEWGRAFQSAIVGIVLINQVAGPILFKVAIRRVGEAGKAAAAEGFDEDAEVPAALVVGTGPDALALTWQLLRRHWRVTLVATNPAAAATAAATIGRLATESRAAAVASGGAVGRLVAATVTAPVASMKTGWARLQDAAVAAGTHRAAAATTPSAGTAATTPAGAAAPAADATTTTPAAAVAVEEGHGEHGGHGPARKLEDNLTTLALLGDDAPAWDNPLSPPAAYAARDGAATAGGPVVWGEDTAAVGGGSAATVGMGVDYRYAALVAAVQRTRALQAVACMAATDAANHGAITAVESAIVAAPPRSHLHSVRLLARVTNPAWVEVYEARGVVPVHALFSEAAVAATLLTASVGRPVPLLSTPPVNNDEFSSAGARLFGTASSWELANAWSATAAATEGGDAALLTRLRSEAAVAHRASSRRGGGGGGAAGAHDGGMLARIGVEAEEVPAWQRDSYLDAIDALSDASRLEEGKRDAAAKKRGDWEMFGSVMLGEEEAAPLPASAGGDAGVAPPERL